MWLKLFKTHTTHAPYQPLHWIKISSHYSVPNILNYYKNIEKCAIFSLFRSTHRQWALICRQTITGISNVRVFVHSPKISATFGENRRSVPLLVLSA